MLVRGRARRRRGAACLTIGFPAAASGRFDPPSDDPFVRQELVETLYHVLWELVHVFFEHRGLLSGRVHDTGASAFLYPFLGEAAPDVEAVVADVAASVRMKSAEVIALREQTLADGRGGARARRPPCCASASARAGGCSCSATAARRPTRWTSPPTSATRRAAGRRGRCSTSPRTRRSSPRSPTTSASRRSSPAR